MSKLEEAEEWVFWQLEHTVLTQGAAWHVEEKQHVQDGWKQGEQREVTKDGVSEGTGTGRS